METQDVFGFNRVAAQDKIIKDINDYIEKYNDMSLLLVSGVINFNNHKQKERINWSGVLKPALSYNIQELNGLMNIIDQFHVSGRSFLVQSWSPDINFGDLPSVTAKFYVAYTPSGAQ